MFYDNTLPKRLIFNQKPNKLVGPLNGDRAIQFAFKRIDMKFLNGAGATPCSLVFVLIAHLYKLNLSPQLLFIYYSIIMLL